MSTKKISTPLWYKDAVIYELSVRAFFDSNGDGIGDFRGLIHKLDYLEDFGINTLWLLPFYDSPLKDDGYDVVDHMEVHPDYGTLHDFKLFLKEAHKRNIHVITELLLNHTSDQHPWFKRARSAKPDSRFRNFYVWSNTPEKYSQARVIVPGEESSNWTWDPEAKAYYWHRFHRYQPELNYDNPEVQLEMFKIIDFWLKLGVDGFRLSSVPFLFEQEGTSCENLPATHAFVKKIRSHIDKHYPNRVLLAEANLWPEDAATYFGEGDECHLCFNYPLMPRLFLGLRTEDSYPIIDIVEQTPMSEHHQWALFLRNHDELGLEMVTEEEKDYLFKAYATDPNTKFNIGIRRRLAPMLNNDRRKIELMYTLLLALPGTPVIYYGDEIGMGDNIYLGDRFGVRTPMQWSMNLNAGFSDANPQKLFLPVITDPVYRFETVNVANQDQNPSSLLWWLRNVLNIRKRFDVFGRGAIRFMESTNSKVLCFLRSYQDENIVVVANLSQFSQTTTLSLPEFSSYDVTEVFSQNHFNQIDDAGTYAITIGPYGYYWFQLEEGRRHTLTSESGSELPVLKANLGWDKLLSEPNYIRLFERTLLPTFMQKCRWYEHRANAGGRVTLQHIVPVKPDRTVYYLLILQVDYPQQLPEWYFLPMHFVSGETLLDKVDYNVQSVVCRAELQGVSGFVIDSCYDATFRSFLFLSIDKKIQLKDAGGVLEYNASVFHKIKTIDLNSRVYKSGHHATSILYNDAYFLKIYRNLELEVNPELEMVQFLSERTSFSNIPHYAGSIAYKTNAGITITLGLLEERIEHQGDAWTMTTDSVGRFFERVITQAKHEKIPKLVHKSMLRLDEAPELIQELIGRGFYERVVRLAQRTAEMHLALASDQTDSLFVPEAFTLNYQRSLYSAMRKLVKERFSVLKQSMKELDDRTKTYAADVVALEDTILTHFKSVYATKLTATKTRIHGDFHLEHVLFTGKDFVLFNFEGNPEASYAERKLKRSPWRDVAGMMRSFHYAAYGKILLNENYRDRDRDVLEQWAEQWQHYVSRFYLSAYAERMGIHTLDREQQLLIHLFQLEKAIYELGYELHHRPEWAIVPLRAIKSSV